jgi:hypothetical protein
LSQSLLVRPRNIAGLDVFVHSDRIGPLEGHLASQHFEQNIASCPNVRGKALIFAIDDFWGLVVDCSDEGKATGGFLLRRIWVRVFLFLFVRMVMRFIEFPGVSEINNLRIIVLVQHYILRLQVSVDYLLVLHEFKEVDQLGEVSPRQVLAYLSVAFADQLVQSAIGSVLEHEIQVFLVLLD